ncbi:MAG TPA: leucine--tRNA ligase, partial [Firmicutes bacterium]|nr:leucine--tRNA ligase [Bacillota bacterium]
TVQNIKQMKAQQRRLGFSYDWSREVSTCSPDYYRWTQWLFLLLCHRGLAYKKKAFVNWCPTCQTVLANEQVEGGSCWRCNAEVEQRQLDQWFLRITDYAERLLNDLSLLEDWPEKVKIMQENWIGRSEGAEVVFKVRELPELELRTFTTRPDTLYGVTFMCLALEHPLLPRLVEGTEFEQKLSRFTARVRKESNIEHSAVDAPKLGMFIGRHAINPINGQAVPIMVSNYVIMGYGTGAVMGVPAHDQRDFLFARQHNLPVKVVIQPPGENLRGDTLTGAYEGDGSMDGSGPYSGLPSEEGKMRITERLQELGAGKFDVSYHLRDWLISRQRYWGAPIPIIYCKQCGTVPVPVEQLPVLLPEEIELTGRQMPPLSHYPSFMETSCPECGGPARREADTMDTFICSSWYFLRYTSPQLEDRPFDLQEAGYWMPVDQYIGGIEHAVLHLLYARFITKVLYDAGLVKVQEPFKRLLAQGMVNKDGAKMSKSRGNVITPDQIVERYGADTGRLFILFAAPPEKDLDWNDQGVEGCYRFLRRVWRLVEPGIPREGAGKNRVNPGEAEQELTRSIHRTIKKVTLDIEERFNFNTAISAIMELVNEIYAYRQRTKIHLYLPVYREALTITVQLLAPFVPHLAEEAWRKLGHQKSVHLQPWPGYREEALQVEQVEVVVQINGKVRGHINVPAGCSEQDLIEAALKNQR